MLLETTSEYVDLELIAAPGDGVAMAAIPLSGTEVIVIESSRRVGYDLTFEQHYRDGVVGTSPALLTDGVLVCTVDASRCAATRSTWSPAPTRPATSRSPDPPPPDPSGCGWRYPRILKGVFTNREKFKVLSRPATNHA